jgi:hypothetical protein
MDPSIKLVQDLLDETARECLRCMSTHELRTSQNQRLAKFIFGCMNQKHELPGRIERRGPAELKKVMKFVATAIELLLEIDSEHEDGS